MFLTPAERTRYHRHLILPEVGEDGQRRLRAARVLVVGVGGLGSPAAIYLAAAGVGALGLVDFDVVDESNLQRQIIHATADIGASKLTSAATRLQALNPHVAVELFEGPFCAGNARALVEAHDLVIDGTDNFPTRYLVNDACVMAGKPNVYGSISRFDGQASVFAAPDGPCYRCLHPEPPPTGLIPNCADAGVLGVLPGLIGLVQATEAIKLITGVGRPLIGRLLLYDALNMHFREMTLPRDPDCPVCGTQPTIRELVEYAQICASSDGHRVRLSGTRDADGVERREPPEITVEELNDWRACGRPHALVDVREPSEHAICRIEGADLLPLNHLPLRLDVLPADRPVVVYCKSGSRSASAAAFLRAQGYDARNLSGGILAWATKIDPRLPRY